MFAVRKMTMWKGEPLTKIMNDPAKMAAWRTDMERMAKRQPAVPAIPPKPTDKTPRAKTGLRGS